MSITVFLSLQFDYVNFCIAEPACLGRSAFQVAATAAANDCAYHKIELCDATLMFVLCSHNALCFSPIWRARIQLVSDKCGLWAP